MERNILITISFNGCAFHGWQIQENAHTAQAEFQNALFKITKEQPQIKACSRTDSGVHARQFCISVKLKSPIPCDRLLFALNHFLPKDMAAISCKEMPIDFHARYDCLGKEYVYEIWNHQIRDPFLKDRALHYWHKIDENQLNLAASQFIGAHNFSAFCTADLRKKGDLVRTVTTARVNRHGDMVSFTVAADGFLYNMVRIMVGTLLKVQEGKINPNCIKDIILSQNRSLAGPTSPPEGLYLNKVFY